MNYKILVILAGLAAIISVFLVSEATAGVLAIGFACLMGILARIAQAEQHHREGRGTPTKANTTSNPDDVLRQYAKDKGLQ